MLAKILMFSLLLSPVVSNNIPKSSETSSYINPSGLIQSTSEDSTSSDTINIPYKKTKSLGVKLIADNALSIDRNSSKILFDKNSNESRAMASTTKVMTAIVALENSDNLDEEVIIEQSSTLLEGSKVDLKPGEIVRLRDLIYAALVASGNDAADAIGLYIGGGDMDNFVDMMNEKAQELGLSSSHFTNPTGLDEDDHYMSARDLAKLFDYSLNNETFRKIIEMREYSAHSLNSDDVHDFKNTNKLLSDIYPKVKGGKTGFTDNAGFSLVNLSADNVGNEIITVVFGCEKNGEQFQDTKALIEWTYDNYTWQNENNESFQNDLENIDYIIE